jgi:hypothetical protein
MRTTQVIVVLALLCVTALTVGTRRLGYSIPGRTAARCTLGHLFTMTWILGGSLTSIHLGPLTRACRCPVGRPAKDTDLTEAERQTLYGETGR